MRLRATALTLALSTTLLACAGPAAESTEVVQPKVAPSVSPAPTEVTSSTAPRTLRREDVVGVVRAGLGSFLQRITLDDRPVFEGGRFKGFRVVSLEGDPSFWRGVDLQRGDVVTKVNGQAIERPEQALGVFHGLASAPELRVSIVRAGAPRELVFPIDGAPAAAPAR